MCYIDVTGTSISGFPRLIHDLMKIPSRHMMAQEKECSPSYLSLNTYETLDKLLNLSIFFFFTLLNEDSNPCNLSFSQENYEGEMR